MRFLRGHPLTRDRMPAAIGRFVKYQFFTRTRSEVVLPWIEGTKLVVRRHTPGASGNFYTGLHEYPDMGFLIHFLREGDLFVDVGANVGSWTVLASGVCGARSVSVEPDPLTARYLARTLAANRLEELARIEQVAIGAENGTVSFTIGLDTENRIARAGDTATREVPVRRLDSLIAEAPDFIKIDVEGFEEGVIEGAPDLLRQPRLRAVSTELCNDAVESALVGAGFERAYYDPASRRLTREPNGLIANNSLFVRDFEAVQERTASAPRRTIYGRRL